MSFSADLPLAYPELILAIGAMVMLVVGAYAPKAGRIVGWGGVAVLAAAAYAAATGPFGKGFSGGLISDAASALLSEPRCGKAPRHRPSGWVSCCSGH